MEGESIAPLSRRREGSPEGRSGGAVGFLGDLGIEPKSQPRIGATESGLRNLGVGPQRHPVGGVEPKLLLGVTASRGTHERVFTKRVIRRAASSPPAPAAGPPPLLQLQRQAGNRAVTALLAQGVTPIQRMAVAASQLEANRGESSTKGLGRLGVSTYASICETLAAYEKIADKDDPKSRAIQEKQLERVERLCTRWINEHRELTTDQDKARNVLVRKLVDEVAIERVRRSRSQAQDTYLSNLSAGQNLDTGQLPSSKFDLKARTGRAAVAGANAIDGYASKNAQNWKLSSAASAQAEQRQIDERMDFVKDHGLTAAEHAAISTYTVDDYAYINAATANRRDWLASTASNTTASSTKDTKEMFEEGGLHTGIVHDGLAKLPDYQGTVYRGEAFDPDRFKEIKSGAYTFPHLASTSKDRGIAAGWACNGRKDLKPNVVLWVISDSGVKDIETLSLSDGEREVLIAAGSPFRIESVTEVDLSANAGLPTGISDVAASIPAFRNRAAKDQWDPAKVYIVRAVRAAKAPAFQDVSDSKGTMRFNQRPDPG